MNEVVKVLSGQVYQSTGINLSLEKQSNTHRALKTLGIELSM